MKEHSYFSQGRKRWARIAAAALFAVGLCLTGLSAAGWAQGQDDNDEGSRLKAIVHAEQLPGNVFTVDGNAVHLPSAQDHFPELQTNTIGFPVSLGTFNAHQKSDVHAYWEFNHGTDWTFPAYELVATAGIARTSSDGLPNTRLDLPATVFDRYAMTREINDGLLAPRFAPGQRGYVQAGLRVLVTPAVPASVGLDSDLR